MNNTTIIAIVVVLIVAGGAYYLFTKKNSGAAPAASAPTVTAASTADVSIQNFSFNPSPLVVKAGTKVTWMNNDIAAHTITSDSGNLLNSPSIPPGQSFSFTFTDPGTVAYHCAIHPVMKGTIVVEK